MEPKLSVDNMLRASKTAFKESDFESYEVFESAVTYLKDLQTKGYLEILDERRESMSSHRRISIVSVRVTDKGREYLALMI